MRFISGYTCPQEITQLKVGAKMIKSFSNSDLDSLTIYRISSVTNQNAIWFHLHEVQNEENQDAYTN